MFQKILIANRGEIALRLIATCREMGIRTVAVYSEADRTARHVLSADEAYPIGPAPATQSYLKIPTLIEVARRSGAEAIHPGYGFLSENPAFAEACVAAGLVFVGPSAEAMRLLGSKIAAKKLAQEAGVPIVPGYNGDVQDEERLLAEGRRIGFPLLIKASAGGGGKGMRTVSAEQELPAQLEAAKREALAAFADETVFLERLLLQPRHIEIQILADQYGTCLALGERECSIQRRHQKILEESPSPALTHELRREMEEAAIRLVRAAGYVNAGTLEFMLDDERHFYFLEMNTRLQVEHPVTELVMDLDLVRQQLLIAAGEPLQITQQQVRQRGHAIEVRLYAEDPAQNFLPSTGTITQLALPEGPGVRIDHALSAGTEVTQFYDPLLAKLIVFAEDRPAAVSRLQRALAETAIFGVTTNVPLLSQISRHPAFQQGQTHTGFLQEHAELLAPASETEPPLEVFFCAALATLQLETPQRILAADPWTQTGPWRMFGSQRVLSYTVQEQEYKVAMQAVPGATQTWLIAVNNQPAEQVSLVSRAESLLVLQHNAQHVHAYVHLDAAVTHVLFDGQSYALQRRQAPDINATQQGTTGLQARRTLTAPMAGTVVKVLVREGETVETNQVLAILSAMKMEHAITAPYNGRVQHVLYREGAVVTGGATVIELVADEQSV